jgi:hypothetical protein
MLVREEDPHSVNKALLVFENYGEDDLSHRPIIGDPRARVGKRDGGKQVAAWFILSGSQASGVFACPEEMLNQLASATAPAAQSR